MRLVPAQLRRRAPRRAEIRSRRPQRRFAAHVAETLVRDRNRGHAFDWDGKYFQLKNVLGDPRPSTPLPILNAAGSAQGREFAVHNADFLFTPAIDLSRSGDEIAALKAQGKAAGRDIDVLTFSHVVCRPTEKEAKDYLQHFGQTNADWGEAVDNLVRLQFAHAAVLPARPPGADPRPHGGRPWRLPADRHAGAGGRRHRRAARGGIPRHDGFPSWTMSRSSPISGTTCCRCWKTRRQDRACLAGIGRMGGPFSVRNATND